MGKQLFSNHASALLAASIDDNDLTIQVESGYGQFFPNPGADEEFIVTLRNADGDYEYCRITTRATDLLTVAASGRGYDGSTAQAWTNGLTRVEMRLTKKIMEEFIQRSGDAMEGDLDMDGNEVQNAELTGDTVVTGGQTVGTKIRGTLDDSSNELDVPSDGTRATAGGVKLLVETDTEAIRTVAFAVGMIMDWYGLAINCPDGWAICDGANGTPNLRDKFIVGAGSAYALNAVGGAATASGTSGAGGAHTPTGAAAGHALTEAELPAHDHFVAAATANTTSTDVDNTHAIDRTNALGGSNEYKFKNSNVPATVGLSSEVGGGVAHGHDITLDAVGDHTHEIGPLDTLPPYYALYKIMFIGF